MLNIRLEVKRTLIPFSLLGALVLLITANLYAEDGVGTLAAEATIYENQTGNNGGGDSDVCVGNLATTGATRRAFIRWNLPAIPSGSVITRVQLVITQVDVRTMGDGPLTATLELRRVTQGWTEGTGSGSGNGPCGGGSNVAGVDWSNAPAVNASVSATEALPSTENQVITMDTDVGTDDDILISDLQFWVDNPADIFGWRLEVSEEATADNARRITPGTLTVSWTEPVDPDLIFANGFETTP